MAEKITRKQSSMIKRIAITGPESTGKSWLAEKLAVHYQTVWVPEYARQYIDGLNRPYNFDDILEIARGQYNLEEERALRANNLLFSDTDFIVLKIWCEFNYQKTHPWIDEMILKHKYDLYLLADIDLEWKFDPQREHPHLRKEIFNLYKKELTSRNLPFQIVSGREGERLRKAVSYVNLLEVS